MHALIRRSLPAVAFTLAACGDATAPLVRTPDTPPPAGSGTFSATLAGLAPNVVSGLAASRLAPDGEANPALVSLEAPYHNIILVRRGGLPLTAGRHDVAAADDPSSTGFDAALIRYSGTDSVQFCRATDGIVVLSAPVNGSARGSFDVDVTCRTLAGAVVAQSVRLRASFATVPSERDAPTGFALTPRTYAMAAVRQSPLPAVIAATVDEATGAELARVDASGGAFTIDPFGNYWIRTETNLLERGVLKGRATVRDEGYCRIVGTVATCRSVYFGGRTFSGSVQPNGVTLMVDAANTGDHVPVTYRR